MNAILYICHGKLSQIIFFTQSKTKVKKKKIDKNIMNAGKKETALDAALKYSKLNHRIVCEF